MNLFFLNSFGILKDMGVQKRSEKKIRLVSCMQWLTEKRVQKKVAQIAVSATLRILCHPKNEKKNLQKKFFGFFFGYFSLFSLLVYFSLFKFQFKLFIIKI